MKRFLALALVALIVGAPAARAQGMKLFEGTWSQVLAEAQRTGKPIYFDAYASWCGPCKLLKKDIFPREDVGAYFNENYISYSLDMEKGEGIELAKKYSVQAYPTHLYFDSNGEIVHRAVGGGTGDEMAAAFISWARDARDPNKQIYTAMRRFDKGDRDKAMMHRLALGAADAGMADADRYARAYFESLSSEELLSEESWSALAKITESFDDPGYSILMKNRAEFVTRYGAAKVEAVGMKIAALELNRTERIAKLSRQILSQSQATFRAATNPDDIRLLGFVVLGYLYGEDDWNGYASAAVKYVDEGKVDNPNELNSIAWTFYEHVDDKVMLEKAATWAKTALAGDDSYAIADTYAAVLFKLGRKADAQQAAEHAIELGRKEGSDFASTEELLGKIKAL